MLKEDTLHTDQENSHNYLFAPHHIVEQIAVTMPDILYVYDLGLEHIIYVNHQVFRILGYSPEAVLAMDKDMMFNQFHPDHYADMQQQWQWGITAHDGEVCSYQVRVRHADGRWRWLSIRETVFAANPHGVPVQVLGVAQDITEHKQIEEAYHTLVDHSLQAMVIIQDGRKVFINPAAVQMTGYTQAEVLAMSPEEMLAAIHPDDQAFLARRLQDQLDGKDVPAHYEFRLIHKHGTLCWLECFSTRIIYNDRPAIQMAYIDITERKQTEKELRRFQQAVEQSPSSIIITNRVGKIEYVNPRFTQLTGYTLEEIQGRTPSLLKTGQTSPETYRTLWQTISAGDVWHGTFCNRTKQGTLYWEAAAIAPIYDDSGQISAYVAIKEDISEKKRIADDLRQSRAFLQAIFDNAAVGIGVSDLHGRFIDMNQHATELLGYTRAEIWAKTNMDITHPDDHAVTHEHLMALVRGDISSYRIEKRYLRKDSSIIWVDLAVNPLVACDGSIEAVVGIMTDITERKKAELALRALNSELERRVEQRTIALARSEARSRALLAAIPDSMFIFDRQGIVLDVETNTPTDLLIPPEQIIGVNLYTNLPADVATRCRRAVDQVCETRRVQVFDYQLMMPTGLHDFEARLVLLDGEQLLGIVRDITERKQTERALQESEARYRTLFEASPEAILLTDPDSTIRVCNRQAVQLFGYAHSHELIGRSGIELIASNGRSSPDIHKLLTAGNVRNLEYTMWRKDGSRFPAELNSALVTDGQEHIIALIILVRDMTERTRLQAQIIASERHAIGGRLAASVAHEINTPLQALNNFLDLIGLAEEPQRQQFLHSATQEVQRIGDIVGQLLDLYRPYAAHAGPVDLLALIKRILLLLGKRIKEQKINVDFDAPPRAYVWGRTDELTQVMLNLLVNALDAMPHGGMLDIACQEMDDAVQIDISDTGYGMHTEQLQHIFEPFVTTKKHGVGLGLYISHQLVRQHGGHLLVDSIPGEGSTFTVILPAVPDRSSGKM